MSDRISLSEFWRYSGELDQDVIVTINDSASFEKCAATLHGDLAESIAGATKQPVRDIIQGELAVVPKAAQKMFSWISLCNRLGIFGWLPRWILGKKGVYGNLITSMFFSLKGNTDKLELAISAGRVLESARLRKDSGEDLEWRLAEGEIEQVLHYGSTLPDGTQNLVLPYSYDGKSGKLKTAGPVSVAIEEFPEMMPLPDQTVTKEKLNIFSQTTKQDCLGSLTFPINCGFLEKMVENLKEPKYKVDFFRITVHKLDFVWLKPEISYQENDVLQCEVHATTLDQLDKGQIHSADFLTIKDGQPFQKVRIYNLIRGNVPKPSEEKIPRISYKNFANNPSGGKVAITMMKDDEIIQFTNVNGDYNPLHRIDGVAKTVGFHRRIHVGLGIAAQVEAAIRGHFKQSLEKFEIVFIRPSYPNKEYRLEWSPQGDSFEFQLVSPKNEKVIVDGCFTLQRGDK